MAADNTQAPAEAGGDAGRVTAAILVIGDEILSGRTKDKNVGFIAETLTEIGIDLCEVRIVPDIEKEIVDALNALRSRYTHVFTTGGIGPTHDDITADAVALAMGVELQVSQRAVDLMAARAPTVPLNQARLRMARIPVGGTLIENAVSAAPGFSVGNVHVMAGVPRIMQAMLLELVPRLATGTRIHSTTVDVQVREGTVAEPLKALQDEFPDVKMGSYPQYSGQGYLTQLVLRSRDEARLKEAEAACRRMVAELEQAQTTAGS